MSGQPHRGHRYSPAVGPFEKSVEQRQAEGKLGVELGPGGLWAHPIEAAAYWSWLRDQQPDPAPCLADLLSWLRTFLGLTDRPAEAQRYFALGFAQGSEVALHGQPLPDAVLDVVPDALWTRGASVVSSLGTVAGAAPLNRLRNWASQWLTHEVVEVPTSLWYFGLSMGHSAAQTHPLVCGMLAAELDEARFDQRFAGRAFVATLSRRDMDPWRAFIRSTYGGPVEGELLSAAVAGSLDRMRTQQGTLRAFLLDAVLEGRSFAQSSSPAVEALLTETGPEQLGRLRPFYAANSGPLTEAAPEGPLLEALRNWIFRSHANLFTANDPGAEHVTLRHAYDYLWWRGFLEGAPDKPTRSFVASGL